MICAHRGGQLSQRSGQAFRVTSELTVPGISCGPYCGQGSLVGYCPRSGKELDTTEQLMLSLLPATWQMKLVSSGPPLPSEGCSSSSHAS